MKYRSLALLVTLPMLAWAAENEPASSAVVTASFDCTAAKSPVEKMICADAGLAERDRYLAAVFSELQKEIPDKKPSIRTAQLLWLKKRDECGDKSCVVTAYRERSVDLLSAMPALSGKLPLSEKTADSLMTLFAVMSPDDLQDATTDANRNALTQVSCQYFERSPQAAETLFGAYYWSTRDAMTPLCQTIDITLAVPAAKGYIQALERAAAPGQCFGTMMYGKFREQKVLRILAAVDASPDLDAYERNVAHRYEKMNYRPDLAHWAQQGLWEKHIYAEVQRTQPFARDGLRKFYISRFHLDDRKAEQVAEYYLQRMMDFYIRNHSGFSSTLSYTSLCLDKSDLHRYLADGKLPTKECPYAEFADTSEPQTLLRLLGLAIVNDYPLDAVKRLLKAGAALEAAKLKYEEESPDSPLMTAAARTDVIEVLLAAGADPNKSNWFGKTPLMYAVAERNLSGVQALLRAGANVDAATANLDKYCTSLKAAERTVLMYAAWHGNADIVRTLLDAHANPRAKDSNGETAVEYAAKNTDVDDAQRKRIRALLRAAAKTA